MLRKWEFKVRSTPSEPTSALTIIRTAEQDMAQLVDWAHDAHDFTTNQGVKPGLLYVVNQDSHADFKQWANVEFATDKIMDKLKKSRRFVKEQKVWKIRGVNVESADQLLHCYYSSVKVVFIPQFLPENPACEALDVQKQYDTLYKEITSLSWRSSESRKKAGLLFDLGNLARHSIGVLEHLAKDYRSSVDLKQLAEPLPYPTNFKTHVLNVLSRLQNMSSNNRNGNQIGSEASLIERACAYLAICISGEILRTPSMLPHVAFQCIFL
jgi:hypothetical protein